MKVTMWVNDIWLLSLGAVIDRLVVRVRTLVFNGSVTAFRFLPVPR